MIGNGHDDNNGGALEKDKVYEVNSGGGEDLDDKEED